MALQRFRLPASGAAAVSPATQAYTHNQNVRRPLPTSDATALASQPYEPDAVDHGGAGDSLHVQFVSVPHENGASIALGASIKLVVQGLEPNANCNQSLQLWLGVYSNDGSTLVATLANKVVDDVELTTSLTNRILSTTAATSHTFASDQRIVAEVAVSGSPAGGGGVQGHNATLRFGSDGVGGDLAENDTETGTTFNPWLEIDITPAAPPQTGTRFHLNA